MEGTIEKWLDDKNFGFIDIGEERGLFFHRNELADASYAPREGDKVEFEKAQGDKGPMAVKVKKAGEAAAEAPAEAPAEEKAEEAPAEEAAEEKAEA